MATINRKDAARDRQVQMVVILEGAANCVILGLKLFIGMTTGSLAILSEAMHSLADLGNNFLAYFVLKASSKPPDKEHPYGHRKFETLAVFILSVMLATLALELVRQAWNAEEHTVESSPWAIALMGVVLICNVAISTAQRYWAKRLKSDLLLADAAHTFSDVLITLAAIVSWQLSARGYVWVDTVCALCIAVFILYLAYGFIQRSLPILVDAYALEPQRILQSLQMVDGIKGTDNIRSRWLGGRPAIDLTIYVDAALPTLAAHKVADEVEAVLLAEYDARDVTVHIEPWPV